MFNKIGLRIDLAAALNSWPIQVQYSRRHGQWQDHEITSKHKLTMKINIIYYLF